MAALTSEVTQLLEAWSSGDPDALEKLIPIVLDDIRELARRHLAKESPGHTLQPTALVNEVYLRLIRSQSVQWANRKQFFQHLTTLMRRILVDNARSRLSGKRGGGVMNLRLEEVFNLGAMQHPELLALDDALQSLSTLDPRQAQIVEMRFFIGLTQEEIADVMGLSLRTVSREWQTARLWLRQELADG